MVLYLSRKPFDTLGEFLVLKVAVYSIKNDSEKFFWIIKLSILTDLLNLFSLRTLEEEMRPFLSIQKKKSTKVKTKGGSCWRELEHVFAD